MNEEKKTLNINIDAISQELSLTRDIFMRIVTKSIPQTTQDITDLDNAIGTADFTTIAAISHRLKGTFDNMRLSEMASAARKMNDIAKTNTGIEKIKVLLDEFKVYFEQLRKFADTAPNNS